MVLSLFPILRPFLCYVHLDWHKRYVKVAYVWGDRCKALRWQLQSFALADAMLCVRVVLNWQRNVCPILDKRKVGRRTLRVTYPPVNFYCPVTILVGNLIVAHKKSE